MVDLTEFNGEDALRASLIKKREKVQEKLDAVIAKAQEKITPLQAQIEKFDALLAVLGAPDTLVNPPTPEQPHQDEEVSAGVSRTPYISPEKFNEYYNTPTKSDIARDDGDNRPAFLRSLTK